MALRHMAAKYQGELTTAKEVCDAYKTPFDVTSKVMQSMAHKGLLKSEQGAHGGYLILKDLSKVSFYDLIQMVEGPVAIVKCINHGPASCEMADTCNIISPVTMLNEKLVDFYRSLPLMELVDPNGKSRPRISRMAVTT